MSCGHTDQRSRPPYPPRVVPSCPCGLFLAMLAHRTDEDQGRPGSCRRRHGRRPALVTAGNTVARSLSGVAVVPLMAPVGAVPESGDGTRTLGTMQPWRGFR